MKLFFSATLLLAIFFISSCNQPSDSKSAISGAAETPLSTQTDAALCDWVDSLSGKYEEMILARLDSHKNFLEKEGPGIYKDKWDEKILKAPIDILVGTQYMDSYRRSIFESKPIPPADHIYTKGVVLTAKELAYYLKYLHDNDLESIQLAFSRFDLASLRANSLTHQELESNLQMNGRITVITGTSFPKGKGLANKYMNPFKIAHRDKFAKTDSTEFYDDWHELWP